MKKAMLAAVASVTALGTVLGAVPAEAQNRARHWHSYGGQYGYNGYHGRWRTGQRFTHWRNNRYVINDYRAYNLPPPRRGYRYYRDDNGDIVMAAIATGVIGLILGSQLGR